MKASRQCIGQTARGVNKEHVGETGGHSSGVKIQY